MDKATKGEKIAQAILDLVIAAGMASCVGLIVKTFDGPTWAVAGFCAIAFLIYLSAVRIYDALRYRAD